MAIKQSIPQGGNAFNAALFPIDTQKRRIKCMHCRIVFERFGKCDTCNGKLTARNVALVPEESARNGMPKYESCFKRGTTITQYLFTDSPLPVLHIHHSIFRHSSFPSRETMASTLAVPLCWAQDLQ